MKKFLTFIGITSEEKFSVSTIVVIMLGVLVALMVIQIVGR